MSAEAQYDDAMFDFSRGEYALAVEKLRGLLAADPDHFDARLALGMALYRQGNFSEAIMEGHRAEALRPKEQLVHTNLSLFYMKAGDKVKAEHHGLQARIAGWREPAPANVAGSDAELEFSKPKPQTFKTPEKFPDMPWKKKTGS